MVHVWVTDKTGYSLVTHGPYLSALDIGIIKRYILHFLANYTVSQKKHPRCF